MRVRACSCSHAMCARELSGGTATSLSGCCRLVGLKPPVTVRRQYCCCCCCCWRSRGILDPVPVGGPEERDPPRGGPHCHAVGDHWAHHCLVDQPCPVKRHSPGGPCDGGEGLALLNRFFPLCISRVVPSGASSSGVRVRRVCRGSAAGPWRQPSRSTSAVVLSFFEDRVRCMSLYLCGAKAAPWRCAHLMHPRWTCSSTRQLLSVS